MQSILIFFIFIVSLQRNNQFRFRHEEISPCVILVSVCARFRYSSSRVPTLDSLYRDETMKTQYLVSFGDGAAHYLLFGLTRLINS